MIKFISYKDVNKLLNQVVEMFEKKKCPNCGEKLKDEWDFCPRCGEEFSDMEKETGNIFDEMEKDFEAGPFNIPQFKVRPVMKGGRIDIIIHGGTGMEPRVDVRTSGDFRKQGQEIKRKAVINPYTEEKVEKKKVKERTAKTTEEPEAESQNVGNKRIISIKLPNVKSESDIEIKKMEQSVEVKAYAGDKAYFKLIPIPANAEVSGKFDKGMLKLEILK